MAFHYSLGNKDMCSHIIYTYWYFPGNFKSAVLYGSYRFGVKTLRSGAKIWRWQEHWMWQIDWGQQHCLLVISIFIHCPSMGACWMGIFFSFDKLLTLTYLLLVQTCWPWLAIQWRSEAKESIFPWADTGIHIHLCLSSNGKSLTNSKRRILCLCRWVKLYLMALFWETRSTRLCCEKQKRLFPPGEHCYPKLSSVRACRWAFVKNCSSNGWLLFMVSCYGASLLMLAGGTGMHFHLTRSSPALSSEVVSIRLWPMLPKSLAGVFFLCIPQIARGGRRGRWRERVGGVIATCHFIQLHFNLGCLEESRSANDSTGGAAALEEGSRDLSCWYLATNHRDMNYSPSNGNPYSSSSPKALLWGCRCVAAFISSPYPLPHPCTLIKTPTYFKALHHLTHIEFLLLHHWVYGPSLGLLMTRHRVTHMNMEISHTVHMLSYITGLI